MAKTVKVGINTDNGTVSFLKPGIPLAEAHSTKHLRHSANIAVNGHGIVVQYNDD